MCQVMEPLAIKLNNIPDSYYGFVVAVLTYVRNKESRLAVVEKYINNNPAALSSDILEFIAEQDDFYEEVVCTDADVI